MIQNCKHGRPIKDCYRCNGILNKHCCMCKFYIDICEYKIGKCSNERVANFLSQINYTTDTVNDNGSCLFWEQNIEKDI